MGVAHEPSIEKVGGKEQRVQEKPEVVSCQSPKRTEMRTGSRLIFARSPLSSSALGGPSVQDRSQLGTSGLLVAQLVLHLPLGLLSRPRLLGHS